MKDDIKEWEGYGGRPWIRSYGMCSDGIQAPGAIVLRDVGGYHPYVVHFFNVQDQGYYHGSYCTTMEKAISTFHDKCKRYDPLGLLHGAYVKYGYTKIVGA